MKYILILFLLVAQLTYGQKAARNFTLVGRLENGNTLRQATLLNSVSGKRDSVTIKDGQFMFTGHVDYPCFAFVSVSKLLQQVVWLSNDPIQVDFAVGRSQQGQPELRMQQISGSQDAIDRFHHVTTLYPLYQQKKYQQINDSIRAYVGNHTKSFYAVNLISTYLEVLGASTAKELLAANIPEAKQSIEAQYLVQRIQQAETNALGKTVPDFTLPDTANKTRRLSTLLKPYTLIHFWASWCVPCREHNPELVALKRTADTNKLQLVGISLDKTKAAWIRAIHKDKLDWIHLSDFQEFDGDVVKRFSVTSIPYLLLIDQNRRVLATNLEDAKRLINER
jgi:peroxiredoxin